MPAVAIPEVRLQIGGKPRVDVHPGKQLSIDIHPPCISVIVELQRASYQPIAIRTAETLAERVELLVSDTKYDGIAVVERAVEIEQNGFDQRTCSVSHFCRYAATTALFFSSIIMWPLPWMP